MKAKISCFLESEKKTENNLRLSFIGKTSFGWQCGKTFLSHTSVLRHTMILSFKTNNELNIAFNHLLLSNNGFDYGSLSPRAVFPLLILK